VCQRVTAHHTRPLGALGHGSPAHVVEQAQRLVRGPGMQVGLGEAAPPDLLLKAQAPLGMPYR